MGDCDTSLEVLQVKVWVDISGNKGRFLSENIDGSQTRLRVAETNQGKVGLCDNRGLCFAPNTLIFKGKQKQYAPIHTIAAADTLMAGCEHSCTQAPKVVQAVFVRTTNRINRLRFDQDTILATPLHPFFDLRNQQVLAGNLKTGDTLKRYDGYAIV